MRTLASKKKGTSIALGIQGIKDFLFGIEEYADFNRGMDRTRREEQQELEIMQKQIRESEIRLDNLAQKAAQVKPPVSGQ